MQGKRKTFILCAVLSIFFIIFSNFPVYADDYNAGGDIVILDSLDLLTADEEEQLKEDVKPITKYGSVMLATGSTDDGASESERLFHSVFNEGESAVLFYIDLGSRRLQIYSDGQIYKKISTSRANEITNSVYREARDGEWYLCAKKVFGLIYNCLDGKTVLRPMRYFQSFFLGLALASIIMYLFMYFSRTSFMMSSDIDDKRLEYIKSISRINFANIEKKLDHKVRHSSSSSHGGGGGGGHSGGGGGSGF